MNLKFILSALLAVWMLNPILIKAQKNAKQDDVVQQTIIGEVNGIKIVEISNSATKVEKQNSDAENTASIQKNEYELKNFISGKTVWVLTDISIDQEKLVENKANYNKLLDEIKAELKLNIIYVEDSQTALLAATSPNLKALYYGNYEESNGIINLHHQVQGCQSCSKNVNIEHHLRADKLTLKIKDDDGDKSDVYYIFNFTKK